MSVRTLIFPKNVDWRTDSGQGGNTWAVLARTVANIWTLPGDTCHAVRVPGGRSPNYRGERWQLSRSASTGPPGEGRCAAAGQIDLGICSANIPCSAAPTPAVRLPPNGASARQKGTVAEVVSCERVLIDGTRQRSCEAKRVRGDGRGSRSF